MAKVQKISASQNCEGMFRARYQHATGIEHSKTRHGMNLLNGQKSLTDHKPKGIRKYNGFHVNIASSVNRFRLSRKLEHGKTDSRRHVCELDAVTTRHCMIN